MVDHLAASGPPNRLTLGARSADLTADLKAPITREWSATTVGGIVKAIAAEHGLEARVTSDLARIPIDQLSQTSESDLHFRARLSRRLDAVAKIGGGALLLVRRGAGLTASGRKLAPVAVLRRETTSWGWQNEERAERASCAAWWQNVRGAKRRRIETAADQPQFEMSETFATEAIARHAADAKLRKLRWGGAALELVFGAGRPEILAETPVDAPGFRPGVDGRWIAARAERRLTGDGLVTRLNLAPEPEAG